MGIKFAINYRPKWVILSNDDMYEIGPIDTLRISLKKIDEKSIDVVFTRPSKYHLIPVFFNESTLLRRAYFILFKYRRQHLRIEKKFKAKFFYSPRFGYGRYFFKHNNPHISVADFRILSSRFLYEKDYKLFDEAHIHGGEDVDLSLSLLGNKKHCFIDYRMGDYMGPTLGNDINRSLRDIAGYIYLNYKIENNVFTNMVV